MSNPRAAAARDDLFEGPLAAFAGVLRFNAPPPDAILASALADRPTFDALVARLQAASGCDDRHAAVSFWSQIYFKTLTIPAVAAALGWSEPLALDLDATQVTFCPTRGTPLAFHLSPSGAGVGLGGPLGGLVEGHIAPLIDILRRHGGLSARLLWENAGWPLVWVLGEAGRLRPACRPRIEAMLVDTSWPAGRCHALDDMKRQALLDRPIRRRTCCLRTRIPGFGRCQGLCPLDR